LLANPPVSSKLEEELEIAIPDKKHTPDFVELEKLPYLAAVVQE